MLFAWRKENEIRLRNVVRWTVKIQSTVSYLANLATSLNIVFLKIKIWNWFKYNTSDLRRKKKKREIWIRQTNKQTKTPNVRSQVKKSSLSLSESSPSQVFVFSFLYSIADLERWKVVKAKRKRRALTRGISESEMLFVCFRILVDSNWICHTDWRREGRKQGRRWRIRTSLRGLQVLSSSSCKSLSQLVLAID